MRIVSAQQLEEWLGNGRVLEKDGRGPKVVALNDGHFLKIFHTRRHPLLARLQPAARRFSCNAGQLAQRGIRTPQVIETFWLDRQSGLSGCLYHPLPGISVEQLYRQTPQQIDELLPALADFIRHLHERGVYFRSLHLGNIIRMPDGQFGLIDILDLRCRQGALSAWQVRRNLAHLRRYLERRKLTDFPLDALYELYRHPAHSQASSTVLTASSKSK
ncbi:phosphotransferase [Azotobacter salinestris]|uniref:phosphotransferase n=1 Tax=Azotobacter salinestris TaxID=69964 RepID=UPI0032E02757